MHSINKYTPLPSLPSLPLFPLSHSPTSLIPSLHLLSPFPIAPSSSLISSIFLTNTPKLLLPSPLSPCQQCSHFLDLHLDLSTFLLCPHPPSFLRSFLHLQSSLFSLPVLSTLSSFSIFPFPVVLVLSTVCSEVTFCGACCMFCVWAVGML